MTSAVILWPIALILTVSADGASTNFAPLPDFNVISTNRPAVVVSFAWDPAKGCNIRATREFVVNSVSQWQAKPMNHCMAHRRFSTEDSAVRVNKSYMGLGQMLDRRVACFCTKC